MADFLDLPGWTTSEPTRPSKGEVVVPAVYAPEPEACTKCGVIGEFDKWGIKETEYRDSPVRGERVTVSVLRRRYRCRSCRATFLQPLPAMEEARRMTVRCREYIEEQCLLKPFTTVAADIGADQKTVRQIAMTYIEQLDAQHRPYAPRALGLDETKLAGKLRVMLVDLDRRMPIDMLEHYTRASIVHCLSHLPDRRGIEVVAMDMANLFREVVKTMLPDAVIVADKWHVLRAATGALNVVRIKMKKEAPSKAAGRAVFKGRHILLKRPHRLTAEQAFRLDGILKNDADLADAYEAKEAFYRIWDSPTKMAAALAIDAWVIAVPARHAEAFKPAVRAVTEWREQVLAYWDNRLTNAYTESGNLAAKQVNRAGRGYTYAVIRARVLFAKGPVKGDLLQCVSCRRLFEPAVLTAHHIVPVATGRTRLPKNALVLCANCHVRFHTEEQRAIHVRSTRKSE